MYVLIGPIDASIYFIIKVNKVKFGNTGRLFMLSFWRNSSYPSFSKWRQDLYYLTIDLRMTNLIHFYNSFFYENFVWVRVTKDM